MADKRIKSGRIIQEVQACQKRKNWHIERDIDCSPSIALLRLLSIDCSPFKPMDHQVLQVQIKPTREVPIVANQRLNP
jgi:hypothetical protein